MSRSLGSASSCADIDDGVVHNVTSFSTTAASTIGVYGKVPVVQRPYSSAVHATSGASSSADFGATQLAILQELQLTMIGLGIWATV